MSAWNLFAIFPAALRALQAGRELSHPAAWKNAQLVLNALVAAAALASACGVAPDLGPELLNPVALIIVAVANKYLTVATTTKVGFGASGDAGNSGGGHVDSNPAAIPPIELVGRAADSVVDSGRGVAGNVGAGADSVRFADGMRQPVPPVDYPILGGADDTYPRGRASGFGDY